MMNTKYLYLILAISASFIACEKDSDDYKSSGTPTINGANIDITGTYTGKDIITYSDSDGVLFRIDTFIEEYTIKSGGNTGYQLEIVDNGTAHQLDINVSGSSFNGTGPASHPWFGGEVYMGSINGDRLSMSYTGETVVSGW